MDLLQTALVAVIVLALRILITEVLGRVAG